MKARFPDLRKHPVKWLTAGLLLSAGLLSVVVPSGEEHAEESLPVTSSGSQLKAGAARTVAGPVRKTSDVLGKLEGAPWQHSGLKEALEELARTEGKRLSETLDEIGGTWNPEKLAEEVAALFEAQPETEASKLLRSTLLRRWAANDPAGASSFAQNLTSPELRGEAYQAVSLSWAETDPEASWQWIQQLPGEPARESAQLTLLYHFADTVPATALSRAELVADTAIRSQLIEHSISTLAAQRPGEALAIAGQISDPALKDNALARIATAWAETDPLTAATLVADRLPPGPAQERAVAGVVQRWSQQEPGAAREWVESFPEGPLRQNALQHLITGIIPAGIP